MSWSNATSGPVLCEKYAESTCLLCVWSMKEIQLFEKESQHIIAITLSWLAVVHDIVFVNQTLAHPLTCVILSSACTVGEAVLHCVTFTSPHVPPAPHSLMATPPSGPCGQADTSTSPTSVSSQSMKPTALPTFSSLLQFVGRGLGVGVACIDDVTCCDGMGDEEVVGVACIDDVTC